MGDHRTVRTAALSLWRVEGWLRLLAAALLGMGLSLNVPGQSLPDLVPLVSQVPTEITNGVYPTVTLSWGVTNQGLAAAGSAFYGKVYFSTNSASLATATVVDSEYYPGGLAPGGYSWWTPQVQVPITQSGTGYFTFVADSTSWVAESDESNNQVVVPVNFHIGLPDLVPIAQVPNVLTGSANPVVTFIWGVTNQGQNPGPFYWSARLSFSTNSTPQPTDRILAGVNVYNDPAAGQARWWTNTVQVPIVQSGLGYFTLRVDPNNTLAESNETNNLLTIPVPFNLILPDLAPLGLQVPASINGPILPNITVAWGLTNQGTAATPGYWYDRIYLSTDPVLDAGDQILLDFYDPISYLAPGQSSWATNSVRLPVVSDGTWYFIFKADADNHLYEAVETNNTLAVPVTVHLQLPDLAPLALQVPSQVAGPPNPTLTFVWGVTNQGVGPAPSLCGWDDDLYLSADPVLDSSDRYLGGVYTTGPVAAGESYWRTNTRTVPITADGDYYLIVKTGVGPLMFESDTNNNTLAVPVHFTIQSPDLVPGPFVVPPIITNSPNPHVSLAWAVTNLGPGQAVAPWVDMVFLSTNAVLDASAWQVGYFSTPLRTLAPGEVGWQTNQVTLPIVQDGTWYLTLVADYNDNILESTLTNNTLVMPFSFHMALPDLVPISQLPSQVLLPPNPLFDVVWGYANQGEGDASEFAGANFKLCTDPTGTNSLYSYDYCDWSPPLTPQSSWWITNTVRLPVTNSGTYYFRFECNVGGYAKEANFSNNVSIVPITFQMARPDLAPVQLAAPEQISGGPGPLVTLAWGVTNQGDYAVPPGWVDQLYLSTNQFLDGSALLLTSLVETVSLPIGGSYWRTNTVRLPLTNGGTFYFLFQTEATNLVAEANEQNNFLVKPVSVEVLWPDLAPVSLIVSNLAVQPPYVTATVFYSVTNQGAGPAIGWNYLQQGWRPYWDGWFDQLYVSPSPVFDATAQKVSTLSFFGPVAAGDGYWSGCQIQAWVDPTVDNYLFLRVNDGGWLLESSDTNNIIRVQFTFAQSPPDLVPLPLAVPGVLSASAFPSFTLTWGVTNQGWGAATSSWFWLDELFWSTNGLLDDQSLLLAQQIQWGPIPPGGSAWYTNSVQLPLAQSQSGYLLCKADANDWLAETDKSNNLIAVPLRFELRPSLAGGRFRSDGAFALSLFGPLGAAATLEASTNLLDWAPVLDFTYTNVPTTVLAPPATNSSQRFYRTIARP